MRIEFDSEKNQCNIRARGISFDLALEFEFESAFIRLDVRKDYGEPRFVALGLISNRVFNLVFTVRTDAIRVISLRKANKREVIRYAYHQNA